jgi:hypothetical protein
MLTLWTQRMPSPRESDRRSTQSGSRRGGASGRGWMWTMTAMAAAAMSPSKLAAGQALQNVSPCAQQLQGEGKEAHRPCNMPLYTHPCRGKGVAL